MSGSASLTWTAVSLVAFSCCWQGASAVESPSRNSLCDRPGAVWVRPGEDPHAALRRAGRDGTICFARARFRLRQPLRPFAGQVLVGHHTVLEGSRALTTWRRTGDGWVVGDQLQQGERNGECQQPTQVCTYPDDVVRDGTRLHRVLRRSSLGPGSFYFDYAANRIYVADDPVGHELEAMVAPTAILSRDGPAGADVTVRGFTVEYVASHAQHGAIETTSPGWVIEHNTVRVNHGAGITADGHVRISDNLVAANGQLGIGGTGESTAVVDNVIESNNTAGFDPGWEAGGGKWALTNGLLLQGNLVRDNLGPGLWTDIDAQDTTFADNVVRDNTRAGIFSEISVGAVIRDNVVVGNGHGFDVWLWGSGILLAASSQVEVAGNLLRGNAQGIGLVQQNRGRSTVTGKRRLLHDIDLHDNRVWMDHGESGAVEDNGYRRLFHDPTITWTADSWRQRENQPFLWNDDTLSLRQWRALGHDG